MNTPAKIDETAFLETARDHAEKSKSFEKSRTFLRIVPPPKEPSWRDINEWADVRALAVELSEQCNSAEGKRRLEQWIEKESQSFINEGRLALAAIAEIASQQALVGTGELLVSLLMHEKTPPQAASIAAQRIRLSPLSVEARSAAWPALQKWIEHWERDSEEDVVFAMRSVPVVGGLHAFDWLLARLESYQNPRLVWSMALAITDWATGTFSPRTLQENHKQRLWPLAMSQYKTSTETTTSIALLQCIAAITPAEHLQSTAALVAGNFLPNDATRAAAAVRAGKFLVRQFEARGATALRLGFAENPPEAYDRFVALLHNIP